MATLPKLTRAFIVAFFLYEVAYLLGAFSTSYFFLLDESHRAISLGLIIILTFLLVRGRKGDRDNGDNTKVPWHDYVLMTFGALGCFYIAPTARVVDLQLASPEAATLELFLGVVTLLVLLEGTRRVSGSVLPALLAFFVAYALFADHFPGFLYGRGHTFSRVIGELYLSVNGIFGNVMSLWTRILVAFILFGGFLQVSGAGKFFIDLALALTGHLPGGAAKVAVIASGLFGTISGSAAADVATTGVITIPMMKEARYRPAFAGAVEAVASTGGVLMPPMMGMVAFMVAEFLDIPYLDVCIAAAIPAGLYYVSLYFLVDLEAKRSRASRARACRSPTVIEDAATGLVFFRAPRSPRVLPCGPSLSARYQRSLWPRGALRRHAVRPRNALHLGPPPVGIRAVGTHGAHRGHHLRLGGHPYYQPRDYRGDVARRDSARPGFGRPPAVSARPRWIRVAYARHRCSCHWLVRAARDDRGARHYRARGSAHRRAPLCPLLGDQPRHYPARGRCALHCLLVLGGGHLAAGLRSDQARIALFVVPFIFCYHPELLMIGAPSAIALRVVLAVVAMFCIAASFIGFLRKPLRLWERIVLACAGAALIVGSLLAVVFGLGALLTVLFVERTSKLPRAIEER